MIVTAYTKSGKHSVRVVGESANLVIKCKQFQAWFDGFDHENMDLRLVNIQSADIFQNGKVIFVKMETLVYHRNREPGEEPRQISGIVFLRGNSVTIFAIAVCEETGEAFVLTIRQPRVPVGSYAYWEVPAGTMDKDDGMRSRVLEEVQEETGLDFRDATLHELGTWVPSTGGCDEQVTSFAAIKTLPARVLEAAQAKIHGADGELEHISLELLSIEAFIAALAQGTMSDAKALASVMLLLLKQAPKMVAEFVKDVVACMSTSQPY